ncbi:hypothetical protein [Sulfurimonas sp.]|uniref:hypothetical protein n=1 Tax=Sulfurimonas sp. TaxID=2022749 RepID=UPI0026017C4D|nr:hypothetical protein [Sulfurimonas sp.]
MKILLLNDNPVVTKLVTLSAQKTDDEVTTAHSVEEAPSGSYDLLVIDDAQYDEEGYAELQNKIEFKKSLFICSRDNENQESFSATIKKPFLPTDMVELFTNLKKNLDVTEDVSDEELLDGLELEGLDDLDELEELDDELILDDEELGESVLDDEEAQKVKELLDETQDDEADDEDLDLDYDLSLDLEDEADEAIADEPLVEDTELEELGIDETLEDVDLDGEVDLDLAELDLEDDALADVEEIAQSEELPEDIVEAEEFEENLQTQIEDAVEELSQEELESEVDEDTLLEIASNEIDSFATLNSKDLKVALGEEVDADDAVADTDIEEAPLGKENENRGVEALKTLLAALDNENVAAAMKGVKITINISFED